jgi:hypothetical protein
MGQVQYTEARTGGIRFQGHPPVCNICGQEITRENFGCSYVESEERKKPLAPEQFERIECTACTLVRESGEALLAFLTRHQL